MDTETITTSIEIPLELHQRLQNAASREGCSEAELIVRTLEETVPRRPRRKIVNGRMLLDPPIVETNGGPIGFTNEQLYDLIDLP